VEVVAADTNLVEEVVAMVAVAVATLVVVEAMVSDIYILAPSKC